MRRFYAEVTLLDRISFRIKWNSFVTADIGVVLNMVREIDM